MDSLPKFYLIGRKALAESPERVTEALRMMPPAGAFVACELDAKLAEGVFSNVFGAQQPIAMVAEFPFDFATIDGQGKLLPGELPEVEKV